MSTVRDAEYHQSLVRELCKLPQETEWVEFKVNYADPEGIGEYLSALSNAAALNGKAFAFMVWGVENGTHRIVGTSFSPGAARKGNEPLESWLLRLLHPKIDFQFHELTVDGRAVVLLTISRAYRHPVRFQSEGFLRIGPVTKPLKEAPDRERDLWRVLDETPFEDMTAAERASAEDVVRLLDYPAYFDLIEQTLPDNRDGIIHALAAEGIVSRCAAGGWDITNLGALLFAKRLSDFPTLTRKAMRVIEYKGNGRIETRREHLEEKGYASGFAGLIGYINGQLPTNEVIGQALRQTVAMYPELAVRELVANALIHQDLFLTGAGPMVEIFADRIEITNPGEPLVDTQRFVDSPPKSRNERLASLMRRFRICEERGSGIDKVVSQVEFFQLPAPLFENPEGSTRAVLFAHKPLAAMDKSDRVRACYLHACLRFVTRQPMTNASLRERFGIEEKNAALASRILGDAVDAGLIAVRDADVGTRSRTYVPFWAVPANRPEDIV